MRLSSHFTVLIAGGILLAVLFCLPPGPERRLVGITQLIMAPASGLAALSLRVSRAAWGGLRHNQENDDIDAVRAELAAAKLQLAAIDDKYNGLALENNLLRNRLRLTYKNESLTIVVAELVQRDPFAAFYDNIVINRGHNDGIRPGQLVATHRGLVGLIADTAPSSSSVTLVTSPKFALACQIPKRNLTGLLRGSAPSSAADSTGPQLLLPPPDLVVDALDGVMFDAVQPGDLVYTSKMDGRAQVVNDILVGAVVRVEHDQAGAPILRLQPAESLAQLPFVHVILK
ncbi:MAG TPA: rod shape-determining protein MreC [Lentisphaeria bacterium]|nr:rod shape-determining protein MreC [Lentisphaeria bacterium]